MKYFRTCYIPGTGSVLRRPVESAQYTALAFTEELAEAGIAGSIGTVGDALDNALMESTIGLYKTELILPYSSTRNWSGVREVERETAEWIRWYNNERIHSSIDYMTRSSGKSCIVRPSPNGARWPESQPLANSGRFTTPR